MAPCLSEQNLESYVAGSGSTEQISAWKSHFKYVRFVRHSAGPTPGGAGGRIRTDAGITDPAV